MKCNGTVAWVLLQQHLLATSCLLYLLVCFFQLASLGYFKDRIHLISCRLVDITLSGRFHYSSPVDGLSAPFERPQSFETEKAWLLYQQEREQTN